MTLRPATPADFPFIRALAQRPDYALYITDEDETRLAFYATDPAHRLQIWEENGTPAGYALWAEIGDPSGRVELRRLALDQAGGGKGLGMEAGVRGHGEWAVNDAAGTYRFAGTSLRQSFEAVMGPTLTPAAQKAWRERDQ